MFDKRILDEISNSKGYSIALLTTFNFEISYFERTILNSLYIYLHHPVISFAYLQNVKLQYSSISPHILN